MIRKAKQRAKERRQLARAMQQLQVERVVARQAWRFVALWRLRVEVRHWPRAATQRLKKQRQFAMAMQQVQAN